MARSHEVLVALDLPANELGALVERAGRRLEATTGWTLYGSAEEFSVRFTVAPGWVPRQQVVIHIERRRVRVISRNLGRCQIFDWGRNRRNVGAVLKALAESVAERLGESLRSPSVA